MQPVNLDTSNLGGLGAMWAGEQQGMAVESERLRQQQGLEQLLKSQQDRQFGAQKQPFELEQLKLRNQGMQNDNEMFPLKKDELSLKVDADRTKQSEQKVFTFLRDAATAADGLSGLEAQATIADVAKRMGKSAEDPVVQMAIRAHLEGAQQGGIRALVDKMEAASQAAATSRRESGQRIEEGKATQKAMEERRLAEIRENAIHRMEQLDRQLEGKLQQLKASGPKNANFQQEIVNLTRERDQIKQSSMAPEDKEKALQEIAGKVNNYWQAIQQQLILGAQARQGGQLDVPATAATGVPTATPTPQPQQWPGPQGAPAGQPPMGGGPTPPPGGAAPPPQAIQMLRSNPGLAQAFDAKYGPGSSARVLQGQ